MQATASRSRFISTFKQLWVSTSRLPITRRHKRVSIVLFLALIFIAAIIFTIQRFSAQDLSNRNRALMRPGSRMTKGLVNHTNRPPAAAQLPIKRHPSRQPKRMAAVVEPLKLDREEELAAVVHFITALANNALTGVDPSQPVPAEFLVDFNVRSGAHAHAELVDMVQNTWFEHPVVVFAMVHSPRAREVKKILDSYNLLPLPLIIEVDKRRDSEVMIPLIQRVTGQHDFPILLVGGQIIGNVDVVRAAHESGKLKIDVAAAGALLGGSEKKKKKKLIVQFSDEE